MRAFPGVALEPITSSLRLAAMHIPKRLATAAALAILLASMAACSPAASRPSVVDRSFLSVGVTDGGAAKPLAAGTRIRLDFRASDLAASAGCNSIGGTYRLEDGRLEYESGAMTDMACDPARMAQDTWLVQLLSSTPLVQLTGDELVLQAGTIAIRFLDRKVAEPDVALTGHAWTVVSIISADAVSSVPAGAVATLAFKGDGTLEVSDGCNQGSARWIAAGSGIEVSDLVLTKKACDGPGGQLESAVVGVLRAGSIAAAIDSNLLTLRAAGNGLQLRAS